MKTIYSAIIATAILAVTLSLSSCADFKVTGGVHSDKYGFGGTYSPGDGANLNVNLDKLIDRNSGK